MRRNRIWSLHEDGYILICLTQWSTAEHHVGGTARPRVETSPSNCDCLHAVRRLRFNLEFATGSASQAVIYLTPSYQGCGEQHTTLVAGYATL